ncbi:hypothetical protein JW980_06025 [Acinetobacter johnsonii]|jgi:hypothetical protein|uniref:Uncharacterized protein n=1 Tax=Acinetobacter johnsonii TaxID=40214 RepID=A0AA42M6X7_ACIJO|nr:hypothetical protein [Acinetobacter johnsonii]MCU4327734.1 hypothetical protein [Acinetobacter johnsonii]MDH0824920.1 hypothetical protein [Acinetobacter johnsonii]QSE46934.1 hypothetical protein JW980_06025 [Acinetobacter johnsonii]
MKITTLLISLSLLPILSHAASNPYNYVTSVKVNQVELNASVTPNQVSQLLAPPNGKTSKQYAKCTGNYEYSITTAQPKTLKFEIFSEDNPKIQAEEFYKDKANFKQLGQIKGRVWLNWESTQGMSENIRVQNIQVTQNYTLQQFKQDFKYSAQGMAASGEAQVLLLQLNEIKAFLKKPQDFAPPYTAYLNFGFKNGRLSNFALQQAVA